MSTHVTAITEAEFAAQVLASPLPVVVDFWATWCGPCRQLAPVLEQVAAELAGRVRFVKVDSDAAPTLSATYDIASVPTLLVFSGGQVVHALTGAKPKPVLLREITAAL